MCKERKKCNTLTCLHIRSYIFFRNVGVSVYLLEARQKDDFRYFLLFSTYKIIQIRAARKVSCDSFFWINCLLIYITADIR